MNPPLDEPSRRDCIAQVRMPDRGRSSCLFNSEVLLGESANGASLHVALEADSGVGAWLDLDS